MPCDDAGSLMTSSVGEWDGGWNAEVGTENLNYGFQQQKLVLLNEQALIGYTKTERRPLKTQS